MVYSNSGASTGAAYNPFRYRGYYYDIDLVMYYLQSRYYDAKICRFINADSALYHSMLGYNMFAYCNNNPINYFDPTGEYCVAHVDDRNPLDDWILEGAGAGGLGATGNYFGYGTSYYTYTVYSATSSYNAYLGGYHTSSLTSGMINSNYYYVRGAVSVSDSMATQGGAKYTPPKGGGGVTSRIHVDGITIEFAHGGRHLESTNLSINDVERAIARDVITKPPTSGTVKHGNVNVKGINIYYNYYTRGPKLISVGTYRPTK